ncbi:TIGR02588 family protein [Crocosphaera sp. XPORK-15E]|uniref:TIGR02588 family protein n=1 Tax=Crocosphaera sp. XPORK-15E TaxID=3110247 RepID=UPI002B21302E|nr:TIGR02588 family protein [Crocosphaera sp. XPORK-15E]MEA5533497.1 TIGR02588 family protein [Crocosphaera sp. XPORK-15E]
MSQPEPKRKRSSAEWITFSISSLILAGIVGLVCYSWLKVGEHPPILVIERSGNIRQVEGNFYVPFTLTNKGGETADAVQVTAELRINGEVEESGEQQIDFLSGGEAEEGVFLFSRNPQNGKLILRVASYQKP